MKYRIFTNDVGPNKYSCLRVIEARSNDEAARKAALRIPFRCKMLVIPDNRRDLGPNGQTGVIPRESQKYVYEVN